MASPLKPYGKINEADEARLVARRKTRKRLVILVLSSIFLVAIIVGAVVGAVSRGSDSKPADSGNGGLPSPSTSVKAVCSTTPYPTSCYSSLSPMVNSTAIDPEKLLQLSVQVALNGVAKAAKRLDGMGVGQAFDRMSSAALTNCKELLGLAIEQLNDTMAPADLTSAEVVDNLKTWLSSSVTYLQTCIDGFDEGGYVDMRNKVAGSLKNSTELTRNSLAILTAISNFVDSLGLRRRRLMSYEEHSSEPEYPGWLLPSSRRLLESSEDPRPKADIVVAKNGKGNYTTIGKAVAAVPEKSKKRFIIYVKKGVYTENVEVGKKKWNVMLVGDGMDATIISGSLNFMDGTPTYSTATFAVMGKGFIARDMGFQNTAGAAKHQAVAMRSGADQSVFYRCRFDAYQDSLYAHSLRQFYRECSIYGTVDFIFGNAAAVFQKCKIYPRVPLPGQQDTITAQGKVDPNQNTGISIHDCSVRPDGDDVASTVKVYLGRPWKPYSTTVFMRTKMDKIIDPAGWLPWNGTTAPDTIFYGEYQNTGPGAATKNRVKWKGLKFLTASQAKLFTVGSFFGGKSWIEKAEVPYAPGL